MAEFVRFTLDDGSEVLFESAESDLVALHGGQPEVRDGGRLTARLQGVAEAAEEVAGSLRSRLAPDEVSLEFGLKVSGGVNWFLREGAGRGHHQGHPEVGRERSGGRAAARRNRTGPGGGVMSGGQAAVARATAAVFVDGRRAGSAVLVDPRYLVTAAHVLQRQDPDTRAKVPVEQVELEFPGLGLGGQPGRTAASRLDLGPAGAGVDVAVLDLGEDRPGWLPAPVPVWPAARPPGRVQVFGYPLAEGPLNGVWRQFTVAGPATAGTVQLDWIGDVGHLSRATAAGRSSTPTGTPWPGSWWKGPSGAGSTGSCRSR